MEGKQEKEMEEEKALGKRKQVGDWFWGKGVLNPKTQEGGRKAGKKGGCYEGGKREKERRQEQFHSHDGLHYLYA